MPVLGPPAVEQLDVVTPGAIEAKFYTIFNPSKKLTLYAQWASTDSESTVLWSSEDLAMAHGDNVATELTATNYLVVSPTSAVTGLSTWIGGAIYKFRFEATNRYGGSDHATVSVKASPFPTGGNFTVSPVNGTAMSTNYNLLTKDWTTDAASLPLKYSFAYASAAGVRTVLKTTTLVANYTTVLPLGDSTSDFALAITVRAIDQVGVYSEISATARVISPPPREANNLATATVEAIDTASLALFQICGK